MFVIFFTFLFMQASCARFQQQLQVIHRDLNSGILSIINFDTKGPGARAYAALLTGTQEKLTLSGCVCLGVCLSVSVRVSVAEPFWSIYACVSNQLHLSAQLPRAHTHTHTQKLQPYHVFSLCNLVIGRYVTFFHACWHGQEISPWFVIICTAR